MFNIPNINDPTIRAMLGIDDPQSAATTPQAGFSGDEDMAAPTAEYQGMGPVDKQAMTLGMLSARPHQNHLTQVKAAQQNRLNASSTLTLADLYRDYGTGASA